VYATRGSFDPGDILSIKNLMFNEDILSGNNSAYWRHLAWNQFHLGKILEGAVNIFSSRINIIQNSYSKQNNYQAVYSSSKNRIIHVGQLQ
jgi:hypothetical protein